MGIAIAPPRAGVAADNLAVTIDSRVALFLDVDGTLLDFADRPSAVAAPAGLVRTLEKVEGKLDGALALVSGRVIGDLDHLFKPLRLRASGVHGAELRLSPGQKPATAPGAIELPASLWAALTEALRDFPGTFAENKRYSFAVHYRLAPGAEAPLRERVTRLIEAEPRMDIRVMDAHYALEVKTPGFDKGSAIAAFLSTPPFQGRTPVFLGDDATDEAGFAIVAAHGGFGYSVGRLREGAIGAFPEPGAVRDWLARFANGGGSA